MLETTLASFLDLPRHTCAPSLAASPVRVAGLEEVLVGAALLSVAGGLVAAAVAAGIVAVAAAAVVVVVATTKKETETLI